MGIFTGKVKHDTAIKMLREQGHTVEPQIRGAQGTLWFEIDRRMLASCEELENLADGVYDLNELEELYVLRRSEEQGQ
jgi:hypothetical protein